MKLNHLTGIATSAFQIEKVEIPLFDYGKLHQGPDHYLLYTPQSLAEAQAFMRYTAEAGIDVRVRASGHTFNGATLPLKDEILIGVDQLDHFRLEEDETLTAGSGAVLWDVSDLAGDYGRDLLVYNGGWAGPSVGGFINAGGFGKGNTSGFHGGLWESINWIKLIDGQGQLHTVHREDELFPWLFGSYGQLGLIVEANFRLKAKGIGAFGRAAALPPFPVGLTGKIPRRQKDDPAENKRAPSPDSDPTLYWFSLLVSETQEVQAWEELGRWADRHQDIVKPDGGWHGPVRDGVPIGYRYFIKYINFHPPLVYPFSHDFLMIGVMCWLSMSDRQNVKRAFAIEEDFLTLAEKHGFSVYLQTQNFERKVDFRSYYGEEVYQTFLGFKNRIDPTHRINRYVFFDH